MMNRKTYEDALEIHSKNVSDIVFGSRALRGSHTSTAGEIRIYGEPIVVRPFACGENGERYYVLTFSRGRGFGFQVVSEDGDIYFEYSPVVA